MEHYLGVTKAAGISDEEVGAAQAIAIPVTGPVTLTTVLFVRCAVIAFSRRRRRRPDRSGCQQLQEFSAGRGDFRPRRASRNCALTFPADTAMTIAWAAPISSSEIPAALVTPR